LVASAVSTSSILLSWADNATNETAYKVERSTDGRNFYPVLGGGANSTRALDTKLTAGKRYYYRVYAMNNSGKSSYAVADLVLTAGANSGPASTPNSSPTPPATPNPTPTPTPPPSAGAPAAPTNLTIRSGGARTIELNWTDNSTNETGFQVERSTDGKTFYRLAGTAGTHNRNTDLAPGKRYYYRVYAVNAAGKSGYSNVVSMAV
jgi:titin